MSKYTHKIMQLFVDEVEKGTSIKHICLKDDMPSFVNHRRELNKYPDLRKRFLDLLSQKEAVVNTKFTYDIMEDFINKVESGASAKEVCSNIDMPNYPNHNNVLKLYPDLQLRFKNIMDKKLSDQIQQTEQKYIDIINLIKSGKSDNDIEWNGSISSFKNFGTICRKSPKLKTLLADAFKTISFDYKYEYYHSKMVNGKFINKTDIDEYINDERITCLVCGRTYLNVAGHAFIAHGMLNKDYKECFGIPVSFGITAPELKEKYIYYAKERVKDGSLIPYKKGHETEKRSNPRRQFAPYHKKIVSDNRQKHNNDTKISDDVYYEYFRRMKTGRSIEDVGKDDDMPSTASLYTKVKKNQVLFIKLQEASLFYKSVVNKQNIHGETRPCIICGDMFMSNNEDVNTCSSKCKNSTASGKLNLLNMSLKNRKDDADKVVNKKFPHLCDCCKNTFQANYKQNWRKLNKGENIYCSTSCQIKQRAILNTKKIGPCITCKKMYSIKKYPHKYPDGYCSLKCYSKEVQ